MQTTTVLADLIPLALKTGILFLLIMAPFKWEKELGGFIHKALKTAGVATLGTAGGLFGGIPYVRNKQMEAATLKQKKLEFDRLKAKGGEEWQEVLGRIKGGVVDNKIKGEIRRRITNQQSANSDIDIDAETEKAWRELNKPENAQELQARRNAILQLPEIDNDVQEEIRSEATKRMDPSRVERLQKSGKTEDQKALNDYQQASFQEAQSDMAERIFLEQAMKDARKSGYALGLNLDFLNKLTPLLTVLNLVKNKNQTSEQTKPWQPQWTTGYFKMNEFLQKWNPVGIMSAYKERAELSKSNMEKAHYRKSKITELVLGPEAALKHQQAIQRDDLSHIYRLDSMRGSAYWSAYEKAVRNFSKNLKINDLNVAGSRFRKELRRMQEQQASKSEYLQYFENLGLNSGEMAAIMEGYDRASTLIAQEARSIKSRDAIMAEAEKAEVDWHKVGNGGEQATSSSTPFGSFQSTVGQQVSQSPNYNAQNIIDSNNQFNFQGMSTDELTQIISTREKTMKDIKSKLEASGLPVDQVQQITQAIRDANGGNLPAKVSQQIRANEDLSRSVAEYQQNRAIEVRALQEHPSPANSLAKIIVQQTGGSEPQVQKIRITVSRMSRELQAGGELTDQDRRTIADAIGQNPSQIDDRMLGHVQQALQLVSSEY